MNGTRLSLALWIATLATLLAVVAAPAGASVVSNESVSEGAAPMVDVGNATIDASTQSSLEVAFNGTGAVSATGDLTIQVQAGNGNQIDAVLPGAWNGTITYSIGASQLSVNESITARLQNATSGTTLATDSATVTVQAPQLTGAAAANVSSVGVGDTVGFDGTGSSLYQGSSWSVRNQSGTTVGSGTGETYNHTFGAAGLYSGVLTVQDGTGHVDTDTVRIAVGDSAPPSAALEGYPSTAAVDESVQLYAGGSTDDIGIETYEWDWTGDGTYEKTTSSPGGSFVTHSYSTTGTKTPKVRVTDYAGNSSTAQFSLTVRPKPNVTHTSVTHTGNGTAPGGTIAVNATAGGGMLVLYLHPQGSPHEMDLTQGGLSADTTTEVRVNLTVENYAPDAVMGGANLHEWNTSPNSNGAGTNFTARLQPVELQRNTSFTGMDPNQWKSTYDQANLAIQAGVYLGAFDMPDGTKFEANMTGATLTSDAQAFMPPRYDPQTGALNYSVAAPHSKVAGGNNSGFYEATIPSGLVDWMGITDPDSLSGTYRSGGTTTDLANMQVSSLPGGGIHLNVTDIHYSAGTVSLTKDSTAPTASVADVSGTAGESVSFDAAGSSDNRKISTYEWDWDGDGTYETSTASTTTSHTFDSDGSYTVTLRVTDGAGNTDTDTATASIAAASGGGGASATEEPTATATSTATATPAPTTTATATPAPTPTATATATTPAGSVGSTTAGDGGSPATETSGQAGFGALLALLAVLGASLLARGRR